MHIACVIHVVLQHCVILCYINRELLLTSIRSVLLHNYCLIFCITDKFVFVFYYVFQCDRWVPPRAVCPPGCSSKQARPCIILHCGWSVSAASWFLSPPWCLWLVVLKLCLLLYWFCLSHCGFLFLHSCVCYFFSCNKTPLCLPDMFYCLICMEIHILYCIFFPELYLDLMDRCVNVLFGHVLWLLCIVHLLHLWL